MKDPYEILGVSRDASEADIKVAYRNLAKRFHPDNFANDPNAKELAEEKMKEINEAYDAIINQKRNGNCGANGTTAFANIREAISSNRIEEAMTLLDNVPISDRNAEWYFLSGSVQFKRGRFDTAYTNFSTACRMDPNNAEYREALNRIQYSRGGYNPYRTGTSGMDANCNVCDTCATLILCDTCCECMGGDIIGCC